MYNDNTYWIMGYDTKNVLHTDFHLQHVWLICTTTALNNDVLCSNWSVRHLMWHLDWLVSRRVVATVTLQDSHSKFPRLQYLWLQDHDCGHLWTCLIRPIAFSAMTKDVTTYGDVSSGTDKKKHRVYLPLPYYHA